MNRTLAVFVVVYLLAILVVSWFASRRVRNEEDYVVAGRRLPLWLAWGTLLATWFGAATMMGAAEAARYEGLRGTLLDPFAAGLALIAAGLLFARPLWEMKLLTIGDYYGRRFGSRAEVAASVILVPGYFGWIGAQYVALGGLMHTFFGVPMPVGIAGGALVVGVYTLLGGMWSVTLTDTLQLGVLLVGLLVLVGSVISQLGDGSWVTGCATLWRETDPEMLSMMPEATAVGVIGWLAVWGNGIFGNLPGQDLTQRIFASRDAITAVRACVLAGVVYLAFGMIPVALGLASRLLLPVGAGESADIMAVLAQQFLSPAMTVVFVISLLSIIISTATSAVLSPATLLAHNLLGRWPRFAAHKLWTERFCVVLMIACGLAMAFSGDSIMGLLEASLVTIFAALFVPLLLGVYGPPCGPSPALHAMGWGIGMWLFRSLLEAWWLPLPEAASAEYSDYLAGRWAPLWIIGAVPAEIAGVLASFAGYGYGLWNERRTTTRNGSG